MEEKEQTGGTERGRLGEEKKSEDYREGKVGWRKTVRGLCNEKSDKVFAGEMGLRSYGYRHQCSVCPVVVFASRLWITAGGLGRPGKEWRGK